MEIVIFGVSIVMKNFENIAMSTETEDAIVQFLKEKLQSGKYKYCQ